MTVIGHKVLHGDYLVSVIIIIVSLLIIAVLYLLKDKIISYVRKHRGG